MEQRNNLVLQGTETFSRGQLDNVALDGGALVLDSVAGRCLQLHHAGICHAGLLQPECQLERLCAPQHHGGGALPGICRRKLDRLDELWQVGTGLPPLQLQFPE